MYLSKSYCPATDHHMKVLPRASTPIISSVLEHDLDVLTSLVPDEIIMDCESRVLRDIEAVIMLGDVSGFTNLCEKYNRTGLGGPSRITEILNNYIGSMVQEILIRGGDVLKFSGDAFLAIWKTSNAEGFEKLVHKAINCALKIQKTHGLYMTETHVVLKVKLAIAAGLNIFAIIGSDVMKHYVIAGDAVSDVKRAESNCSSGEIVISISAWNYVGSEDYTHRLINNGSFVKLLGSGRPFNIHDEDLNIYIRPRAPIAKEIRMRKLLLPFMLPPVQKAIMDREPVEYLTEMRQVVIVFVNVITTNLPVDTLIAVIDECYQTICRIVDQMQGCVNKVSLFDKDMMFLAVFGLRGYKHSFESQSALKCAAEIQRTLTSLYDITEVSVGVTTGVTYCGIVGHPMRREYTVIGGPVNKAARLMMAYCGKVTCDRTTFMHSKLEPSCFILQEPKSLKGLSSIGPIYEYIEIPRCDSTDTIVNSYPLLGRQNEIELAHNLTNNLLLRKKDVIDDRSKKYSVLVIKGQPREGKTRLLEEMLHVSSTLALVQSISLSQHDIEVPYSTIRRIFENVLDFKEYFSTKDKEDIIQKKIGNTKLSSYMCCFNQVFNVNFPITSSYKYLEDGAKQETFNFMMSKLMHMCFTGFWVIGVDDCEFIDEKSWITLSALMVEDFLFFILTLGTQHKLRKIGEAILSNNYVYITSLNGIDKWYHIGIACQILAVSAIPPALESMLHTWSDGNPGWIESYLVSLLQAGGLDIRSVPENQIAEMGLVVAPHSMLTRPDTETTKQEYELREAYLQGWQLYRKRNSSLPRRKCLKMKSVCTIRPDFKLEEAHVEVTVDVMIIKMIDGLTNRQMHLLKCSSVLGEVFSRRMLEYVLNEDSREISVVIQHLFELHVLMCAQGDFCNNGILMVEKQNIRKGSTLNKVVCNCKCLPVPDYCNDLPKYASCGYMKFRSKSFRYTTHNLLTDKQKKYFHRKAVEYLETETQRCAACGGGYFESLIGLRNTIDQKKMSTLTTGYQSTVSSNQRSERSSTIKSVYQKMQHDSELQELYTSAKASTLIKQSSSHVMNKQLPNGHSSELEEMQVMVGDPVLPLESLPWFWSYHLCPYNVHKSSDGSISVVRSFSSFDFSQCHCAAILGSTFRQLLEHCREADLREMEIDAMLEYARLSIQCCNIPQAMKLLDETTVITQDKEAIKELVPSGMLKVVNGKILTLTGYAQMELGQAKEAEQLLYSAMQYYGEPYPTSQQMCQMLVAYELRKLSFMRNYCTKLLQCNTDIGSELKHEMSVCLGLMYIVFKQRGRPWHAALAAIRCLKCALQCGKDMGTLCLSYSYALDITLNCGKLDTCQQLERDAVSLCWQNRSYLDASQLSAVARLYATIFTVRLTTGRVNSAVDIGLKTMRICTSIHALFMKLLLMPDIVEALLMQQRLSEAVQVLQELEFISDEDSDKTGHTWFYALCMELLLRTGYGLLPFEKCSIFFEENTYGIRNFQAQKRLFTNLWLWCIQKRDWESATLYEKFAVPGKLVLLNPSLTEVMTAIHLLEGMLLSYYNEYPIISPQEDFKLITAMFDQLTKATDIIRVAKPRLIRLQAYREHKSSNGKKAIKLLHKARIMASSQGNCLEVNWIDHSSKVWTENYVRADFLNIHVTSEYRDWHECELNNNQINFDFQTFM